MSGTTSPFAKRVINVTFQLNSGGTVDGSGQNTITFSGHRVVANIEKGTLPSGLKADVTIYGLSLDHINQLSVAGLVWQQRVNKNIIQVDAGDADTGMSNVYTGLILEASPDFEQPDSPLHVMATASADLQLKPVPPNSYATPTSVETVLGALAAQGGWGFENNGVNTILAGMYLPGTIWSQVASVVRAAGCFACLDDGKNVLAVWPKAGARVSPSPAVISSENGMIGYPHFQANMVTVRNLFDPALDVFVGKPIQIVSQLVAANGSWMVTSLHYDLTSEMPGGHWEMVMTAAPNPTSISNTSSTTALPAQT